MVDDWSWGFHGSRCAAIDPSANGFDLLFAELRSIHRHRPCVLAGNPAKYPACFALPGDNYLAVPSAVLIRFPGLQTETAHLYGIGGAAETARLENRCN